MALRVCANPPQLPRKPGDGRGNGELCSASTERSSQLRLLRPPSFQSSEARSVPRRATPSAHPWPDPSLLVGTENAGRSVGSCGWLLFPYGSHLAVEAGLIGYGPGCWVVVFCHVLPDDSDNCQSRDGIILCTFLCTQAALRSHSVHL